jgi:peptidoglycan lytic transglycosylase G
MTIETPTRDSKLLRVLAVTGLVAVGVTAVFLLGRVLAGFASEGSTTTTVVAGVPVTIDVPQGASARSIGEILESEGVVGQRDLIDVLESQGLASQLKPGVYHFVTGMSPEDVATRLVAGPDVANDTVIVLEGVTVEAAITSLAEQTGVPEDDFASALTDGSVTSPYLPSELPDGADPLARWEGLLYPARYEIRPDDTPAEILQQMADEMVDRVESIDRSRFAELGITTYDALIIASLIQREAGVPGDRPLISSVIHNRLAAGMPLQIDATVVYALGGSPGRVLAEHLQIDSPWNTYRTTGLPPTPIGTVQIESLAAAVDPATTNYLYYVLVSKDGTHGFSETLEEHRQKIEQAKADGVLP